MLNTPDAIDEHITQVALQVKLNVQNALWLDRWIEHVRRDLLQGQQRDAGRVLRAIRSKSLLAAKHAFFYTSHAVLPEHTGVLKLALEETRPHKTLLIQRL